MAPKNAKVTLALCAETREIVKFFKIHFFPASTAPEASSLGYLCKVGASPFS